MKVIVDVVILTTIDDNGAAVRHGKSSSLVGARKDKQQFFFTTTPKGITGRTAQGEENEFMVYHRVSDPNGLCDRKNYRWHHCHLCAGG